MIYDGPPSTQLPELAAVAIDKLKKNTRCLYLNSPAMVAGFRSYLAAAGIDVAKQVKEGALLLSSDQGHLTNGRFDVPRMLGMLSDALRVAQSEGYSALWATGDMMWELGSERNFKKLLEYEYGLEELLQEQPALSGICQYHKEILPIDVLHIALSTHEAVFINQTLSRINPFYTSRTKMLRHPRATVSALELEQMLSGLQLPINPTL